MTATQWVLIGLVILLIIAYPILMRSRNKKEQEKLIEQTNSLKRGDKILTTSGVYGTIIEVREEDGARKVVIETGNAQYKSYMTVDAYAIYTVIKDEQPATKVEDEKVEEKKEEVKVEETIKEEKPKTKKSTSSKKTQKSESKAEPKTKKTTTKKETK